MAITRIYPTLENTVICLINLNLRRKANVGFILVYLKGACCQVFAKKKNPKQIVIYIIISRKLDSNNNRKNKTKQNR